MTPQEHVTSRLISAGATPDEALQYLAVWEVVPYEDGGELLGVGLINGTEFHCLTLPGFKVDRPKLREYLRPLIEREGMLTTRLAHADTANRRFNRLFGFKHSWSDDQFHYYVMDELPFQEH